MQMEINLINYCQNTKQKVGRRQEMLKNGQDIGESNNKQEKEVSDKEYFENLRFYKPLCYSGKGSPLFLLNQRWYESLGCLGISDLIYIMMLILFVARYHPQQLTGSNRYFRAGNQLTKQKILLINIGIFLFLNLTYLLTQFLNPGIINITTIPDAYYQKKGGKIFCASCNGYRTKQNMKHCRSCDVCVWGLDHHCGFFNKCIAGYQAIAFYGLMVGAFMAFIGALVTLALITL